MLLMQNNLLIRTATLEDAGQLAAWWNDGEVMAHAGFPRGLGTTQKEVSELLALDRQTVRLMIEIDKKPAGEMCYRNLGDKMAEMGIKICEKSMQGLGYGTRLISLLISELFSSLDYEKIVLDTNLHNTRAQHVYEKLGFTRLGTRKDCWTDQLGELQSAVDYELCKLTWNALRQVRQFLDAQGRLKQYPVRRSKQLQALIYLASKFDKERSYTEAELNELLKQWHTFGDWALLRRDMVDMGLLSRNPSGSEYRLCALSSDAW